MAGFGRHKLGPHTSVCSIGILYGAKQMSDRDYASVSHLAMSFSRSNLGSSGSATTVGKHGQHSASGNVERRLRMHRMER